LVVNDPASSVSGLKALLQGGKTQRLWERLQPRPMTGYGSDQLIEKIVSGGQSGVDRAALDVALRLGITCGGWCPRGRLAEDGPIDSRYPLTETPTANYPQRTEWNVRDSDATLILIRGELGGGTRLTREIADRLDRPYLVVDLDRPPTHDEVRGWFRIHRVQVLNVAGPRETGRPGIQAAASDYLHDLLAVTWP